MLKTSICKVTAAGDVSLRIRERQSKKEGEEKILLISPWLSKDAWEWLSALCGQKISVLTYEDTLGWENGFRGDLRKLHTALSAAAFTHPGYQIYLLAYEKHCDVVSAYLKNKKAAGLAGAVFCDPVIAPKKEDLFSYHRKKTKENGTLRILLTFGEKNEAAQGEKSTRACEIFEKAGYPEVAMFLYMDRDKTLSFDEEDDVFLTDLASWLLGEEEE